MYYHQLQNSAIPIFQQRFEMRFEKHLFPEFRTFLKNQKKSSESQAVIELLI